MNGESLREPSWRPIESPDGEETLRSGTSVAMAEGLVHSINNLMSTVLGNAALLRDTLPESHPGIGKLDTIQRAAEEAAEMTRHMLSVSRARSSKREPVNLNTIVYHVLLSEEQRLAPRIRIIRYINPDLWKVAASHSQIVQVALELARNAVEAISGKGHMYIGTRNLEFDGELPPPGPHLHAGKYVLLTVEDNGCGMSAETRARIFEPGFTTKEGRSGMGLSRVGAIVATYGGHISVSSAEGHGSVFRTYLPVAEEPEVQTGIPANDLAQGTETVLIIDDEPLILEVTRETLDRLGYRTLIARNGQEAVDIARRHTGPIHVALLDLVMPVMGGAEAYPLLREARPDMRIIICTGLEPEVVSQTLMEEGAVPFLRKPFRPVALAQEIRKALDEPAGLARTA